MPARSKRPITVRLDRKAVRSLDALAKSMDRDRSYLLAAAVDNFIEINQYQIEQIKKGMEEADRGDLIDHADVLRRLPRSKRAR